MIPIPTNEPIISTPEPTPDPTPEPTPEPTDEPTDSNLECSYPRVPIA